ncbi:hypothetical protein VTO42DRAFT_6827 [Malbranchea cinnamomea]
MAQSHTSQARMPEDAGVTSPEAFGSTQLAQQFNSSSRNTFNPPRLKCSYCPSTFRRPEHLKRHTRIHTDGKAFRCEVCGRAFSRTDSLQRHRHLHNNENRNESGEISLTTVRVGNSSAKVACGNCVVARSKCSGTLPCARCARRNLGCVYRQRSAGGNAEEGLGSQGSSSTPRDNPQLNTGSDATMTGALHRSLDDGQLLGALVQHQSRAAVGEASGGQTWYNQNTSASGGFGRGLLDTTAEPDFADFHPQLLNADTLSSINWLGIDPSSSYFDSQLNTQVPLAAIPMSVQSVLSNPAVQLPSPNPPSIRSSGSVDDTNHRRASQPFISGSEEASHPSMTSTETTRRGEYYVDGDGGREPTGSKRRKLTRERDHHSIDSTTLYSADVLDGFPDSDLGGIVSTESPQCQINTSAYDEMVSNFNRICVGDSCVFGSFKSAVFPSLLTLSMFVQLYFKHFHPVYPLIHVQTQGLHSTHWLLILAMAAIGSHYSESCAAEAYTLALHEFLRRAIAIQVERQRTPRPELWLVQAAFLNCIGLFYTGNRYLEVHAARAKSVLMSLCKQANLLDHACPGNEADSSQFDSVDSQWAVWGRQESARRTGYLIWLLDSILHCHFNVQLELSLEMCQAPLPCPEAVWEAATAEDWLRTFLSAATNPTLSLAIQQLYLSRTVKQDIGEQSRILLIHAICHVTWSVARFYERPMANWTPTAAQLKDIPSFPMCTTWLPAIPIFSKWRNSACDALDVLHWAANAAVAVASGVEHPTVGHLHFSRIVLLTPFTHIRDLAYAITEKKVDFNSDKLAFERQQVLRWVTDDQHKARLSIIHAGVLFWHIRRFSVDSFHEPMSIFMATLILWAYGFFHHPPQPTQRSDTARAGEADSGSPDSSRQTQSRQSSKIPNPSFVLLDRPCDDELVQLFVRQGATMRGCITGVWDICSEAGPEGVLKEGLKLLVELEAWGIKDRLTRVLEGMIALKLRNGR